MAQGIDLRSNFFAIAIILLRASDMCLLGKWSANRSPPKNRKRIRLNWNKQPWTDSIDSPINHGYIEVHSTMYIPTTFIYYIECIMGKLACFLYGRSPTT